MNTKSTKWITFSRANGNVEKDDLIRIDEKYTESYIKFATREKGNSIKKGTSIYLAFLEATFKRPHCGSQIQPILEVLTPDICRLQKSTLSEILVEGERSRKISDQKILSLKAGFCEVKAKSATDDIAKEIGIDFY